jgi:hypothetical protein
MHTYLLIEGAGLVIALIAAFFVALHIRAWLR